MRVWGGARDGSACLCHLKSGILGESAFGEQFCAAKASFSGCKVYKVEGGGFGLVGQLESRAVKLGGAGPHLLSWRQAPFWRARNLRARALGW